MIPRIIHYCWFGKKPKPKLAYKCIQSWKEKCQGYKIIEWNEDNYNISQAPMYVQQAYKAKKWAYVTDYVRLFVVNKYGGIYLDTDVQTIKSYDFLLKYSAFFGFENTSYVNTGLGFGAEKGLSIIKQLMDEYEHICFIKENGEFDLTPCPQINTKVLIRYGLIQNGKTQLVKENIIVLASDFLCPIDYDTLKINKTLNTVSIHWFDSSWMSSQEKKIQRKQAKKAKLRNAKHTIMHIPNRIVMLVLGKEKYDNVKQKLKRR